MNVSETINVIKNNFNNGSDEPSQMLLEAIALFFGKMGKNFYDKKIKEVEFICTNRSSCKKYKINENDEKSILVNFGNIDDLNLSSTLGLVAHLFALIDLNYHEKFFLKNKEILDVDLLSDNVARKWGFKKEIDDLRKIRIQKLADEVNYPNIVLNKSVSKKFFQDFINQIFKKELKQSNIRNDINRIWYVDRFSMICSLKLLKKKGVKKIYIITNRCSKNNLENCLKNFSKNR